MHSQTIERYHSLDGVRASMMLLGIFFHVAWFMVPLYFGTPQTDASSSWVLSYFFYWVHTFRMQAFFLIAGFFACLLIEKRGSWNFIKNRALRVAFPFVVLMLVLYPVMQYQYIWGGLASGRIQSNASAGQLLWEQFSTQDWWQVWPIHFWFLECLVLLYALALGLMVVTKRFDPDRHWRDRLQRQFERLFVSAAWIPVATAVIAGLLIWDSYNHTNTWYGIDSGPLQPRWLGVMTYWVFFAVGWCLFRQPQLLDRLKNGWALRVAAGTALSLVLCLLCNRWILDGKVQWVYPLLVDTEIRDYDSLRGHLLAAGKSDSATAQHAVWESLSPAYQRFLQETPHPTSDQLTGLALELSLKTIANPDFAPAQFTDAAETPGVIAARPTAANGSESDAMLQRRATLERVLAPAIATRWQPAAWIRIAYFGSYALTSWLLVLGVMGFFEVYAAHPSRLFRYLADSSYWLYIAHIPVQFMLLLAFAELVLPWWLKFSLYCIASFAILLPSYHYLVRSTWLGWFLNGKRYPFEPFLKTLWPAVQHPAPTAAPIPKPHYAAEAIPVEAEADMRSSAKPR